MKRRTRTLEAKRKKKAERERAKYRSMGTSHYARKVAEGQMYGPMLTQEQVNVRVGRDARVRQDRA